MLNEGHSLIVSRLSLTGFCMSSIPGTTTWAFSLQRVGMQGPKPRFIVTFKTRLDEVIINMSIHLSLTKTCHLSMLKVSEIGLTFLPRASDMVMNRDAWPSFWEKEYMVGSINSVYHSVSNLNLSLNCPSFWSCFWSSSIKAGNPPEFLFISPQHE